MAERRLTRPMLALGVALALLLGAGAPIGTRNGPVVAPANAEDSGTPTEGNGNSAADDAAIPEATTEDAGGSAVIEDEDLATTVLEVLVVNTGSSSDEDPADVLVEGATVLLRWTAGESTSERWRSTDSHGIAAFDAVPRGTVTLLIIAEGRKTFGRAFELTEETVSLRVPLDPL